MLRGVTVAVAVAASAVIAAAGERTASAQMAAPCSPECLPGQTCVNGMCMIPATCSPACNPGQTCVNGVCMIPAPPPPSADAVPPPPPPPPAATAAPTYQLHPPDDSRTTTPGRSTGLLFVASLGAQGYQGDGWIAFGPGLRLSALLGGRVSETFSLGGEGFLDFLNRSDGRDPKLGGIALAPLLHARPAPNVEVVVGPKLGYWWLEKSGAFSDGELATVSGRGWLLGINAGAFMPVSKSIALGALLSLSHLQMTTACTTIYGEPEMCGGASFIDNPEALALSFALLL